MTTLPSGSSSSTSIRVRSRFPAGRAAPPQKAQGRIGPLGVQAGNVVDRLPFAHRVGGLVFGRADGGLNRGPVRLVPRIVDRALIRGRHDIKQPMRDECLATQRLAGVRHQGNRNRLGRFLGQSGRSTHASVIVPAAIALKSGRMLVFFRFICCSFSIVFDAARRSKSSSRPTRSSNHAWRCP